MSGHLIPNLTSFLCWLNGGGEPLFQGRTPTDSPRGMEFGNKRDSNSFRRPRSVACWFKNSRQPLLEALEVQDPLGWVGKHFPPTDQGSRDPAFRCIRNEADRGMGLRAQTTRLRGQACPGICPLSQSADFLVFHDQEEICPTLKLYADGLFIRVYWLSQALF